MLHQNGIKILLLGLNVVEVAHDNCSSVKNYITKDLNLINSYDTWHGKLFHVSAWHHLVIGTKNVAKSLKTVAVGTAKTAGVTWFTELSDKSTIAIQSKR